jgi:putative membrane protein
MRTTAFHFAVVAGLISAIPAGAFAASSNDFLNDAIKGDNSDIQLGQLAEQKAEDPKVRDFGKTLAADHTKAKELAAEAGGAPEANPPGEPDAEGQQEYQKLSGLSGKAFDQEFVRYVAEDNSKDIQKFQQEANARDGESSKLAARVLPTLREHLKTARSLEGGTGQQAARQ